MIRNFSNNDQTTKNRNMRKLRKLRHDFQILGYRIIWLQYLHVRKNFQPRVLSVAKNRLLLTSKTTVLCVPPVLGNLKKSYLRQISLPQYWSILSDWKLQYSLKSSRMSLGHSRVITIKYTFYLFLFNLKVMFR